MTAKAWAERGGHQPVCQTGQKESSGCLKPIQGTSEISVKLPWKRKSSLWKRTLICPVLDVQS